jgi:hypothetical protein
MQPPCAKDRPLEATNHPTQRILRSFSGIQQSRQIIIEIEKTSVGQILTEYLAEQVNPEE